MQHPKRATVQRSVSYQGLLLWLFMAQVHRNVQTILTLLVMKDVVNKLQDNYKLEEEYDLCKGNFYLMQHS